MSVKCPQTHVEGGWCDFPGRAIVEYPPAVRKALCDAIRELREADEGQEWFYTKGMKLCEVTGNEGTSLYERALEVRNIRATGREHSEIDELFGWAERNCPE